jgi:iron complex outermembrane recepter protein
MTRKIALSLCAATGVLAIASAAHAQAASDTPPVLPPNTKTTVERAIVEANEIVVTGTSLRHVAPAGAESINLSQTDIAASGATSTQQLLADIPQLSAFGSTPYPGIGGTQLTVNRIDLRALPQGTGGGSPTLVLMDGHRFVGDGVNQTIPDPGVIPPGMIDHVEVVMDGGSAVYGADAIGGVINFITKHDFDGIQVTAHHGFGEEYETTNIDVLTGKKWSGGSVYVGYSFGYNSNIANANRSYEHQYGYTSGSGAAVGVQCNAGNVQTAAGTYAITGPTTLTAGTGNLCDTSKYADMFPKEVRHAVMAGFHQELTPSLELEVKGFYALRTDTFNNGYLGYTLTEQSTYPGYVSTGGGSTATQSVSGNFSSVQGNYVPTITRLSTWGITPTLTWKMGHDWQMRAFYNIGGSRTTVHNPTLNTTDLQADVAAGTFNPYDPGAASNAAAVADALNYDNYGLGVDHMNNAKAVFDGPVFRLPGGEVRAAVGSEWLAESYHGVSDAFGTYQAVTNTAVTPLSYYHRHEESGFAELNIPVIGESNALPFLKSFNISAAERYDRYSDFGGNWAPSLGATLKPVSWITFRTKWNKSFQAPSPAQLAFASPVATYYPAYFYYYDPLLLNSTSNLGTLGGGGHAGASSGNGFIGISGTNRNLQPQRATTYDLGFDVSPPVVPGLTLHVTYFHINYKGIISVPPEGFGTNYWSDFQNTYAMNPSYAQALSIMQATGASAASIAQALTNAGCTASSCNLYAISSTLTQNLGGAIESGLDLGFDFRHATGFGQIYASMNGTYMLDYKVSPNAGAAYSANGVGNENSGYSVPRFNFVTTLGTQVGRNFLAQIKWNHVDGLALSEAVGLGQTSFGSFNTFDLYTQYTVDRGGLPPIVLSLGITNMFNTSPPVYNGTYQGLSASTNGYADSTFGRVVQLGASIKF